MASLNQYEAELIGGAITALFALIARAIERGRMRRAHKRALKRALQQPELSEAEAEEIVNTEP